MAVELAMISGPVIFGVPPAGAVTAPLVDPAKTPPDTPPGPEQPMRMIQSCAVTGVLPGSDLGAPPAGQAFMNLPALWQSAGRGAGVTVALWGLNGTCVGAAGRRGTVGTWYLVTYRTCVAPPGPLLTTRA